MSLQEHKTSKKMRNIICTLLAVACIRKTGCAVAWDSTMFYNGIKDLLNKDNIEDLQYSALPIDNAQKLNKEQKEELSRIGGVLKKAGFWDSSSLLSGSGSYFSYDRLARKITVSTGMFDSQTFTLSTKDVLALSDLLVMAVKGDITDETGESNCKFAREPVVVKNGSGACIIDVQSQTSWSGKRYYWFTATYSNDKTFNNTLIGKISSINKKKDASEQAAEKLKLLESIPFVLPSSYKKLKIAAGVGGVIGAAIGVLIGFKIAPFLPPIGSFIANSFDFFGQAASANGAAGLGGTVATYSSAGLHGTSVSAISGAASAQAAGPGLTISSGAVVGAGGALAGGNITDRITGANAQATGEEAGRFVKTKYDAFNFTETDASKLYELIVKYKAGTEEGKKAIHTRIIKLDSGEGYCRQTFRFNGIEFDVLETTLESGSDSGSSSYGFWGDAEDSDEDEG